MRRGLATAFALLALALLAWGAWLTREANRRDFQQAELILDLQAQRISRHVDGKKPEYTPYLQRVMNAETPGLRLFLYDLSGWESGRTRGTLPWLRLNETAARMAPLKLIRPRSGETPLTPFPTFPPELIAEKRFGNRLFGSNIIGSSWVSVMASSAGDRWLVATTPVPDHDRELHATFVTAWVQSALPLAQVERPMRERWARFGMFALGVSALLGGAGFWVLRKNHSLSQAAAVAEQIPLERVATARLPAPSDDPEGNRLVQACNRLLERVAAVHVAQQRFVADAAHELRTPLTILRGEIQVALREPANHTFLIETLRSNLDEAVHLSRLVDSLLTLARADAGQALVIREPVELAPLVRSSLAKLESLAAQRRVRLELEVVEDAEAAFVKGDSIALDRVVFNLVENAMKHSPANHAVTVAMTATSERVRLAVTDRGIGMAPEHLPYLFERFYRVDAARRRADGGVGLGLAIVKTLVEAHGGSVSVRSEVGVGSTFTVELPRDTPLP